MDTLITKLKGASTNGLLPVLNTIYISYVKTSGTDNIGFSIMTGSKGVTVSCDTAILHPGSTSAEAVSTYDVDANTWQTFLILNADKPSADVAKLIKIKGDGIYSITAIDTYASDELVTPPVLFNNIADVLRYGSIE